MTAHYIRNIYLGERKTHYVHTEKKMLYTWRTYYSTPLKNNNYKSAIFIIAGHVFLLI